MGLAGSGLRVNVGVKSVVDMEAIRGAGLCSETVEGAGSSDDMGREEVGDLFRLIVAEECDVVATLSIARVCKTKLRFSKTDCVAKKAGQLHIYASRGWQDTQQALA